MHTKRILEIGAGPGNRLVWLRKRGDVTAIDLDPPGEATRTAASLGIVYLRMDAARLAFSDDTFDEVHAYDVLEHVSELAATVREIARVLKPGGVLIGEVPHPRSERMLLRLHPGYWTEVGHARMLPRADLEAAFSDADITLERVKTKNGVMSLQIAALYLCGGVITGQRGEFSNNNRLLNSMVGFFLDDVLRFPVHRWFAPVWILSYPIGKMVTAAIPKSTWFIARKAS